MTSFFRSLPTPVTRHKEVQPSVLFFKLGCIPAKEPPKKKCFVDPKLYFGEHDILFINKIILEKLNNRANAISTFQSELELLSTVEKESQEPVDKILAIQKISSLREKIKSIETGLETIIYRCATENIINEYKSLCASQVKSFIGTSNREKVVEREKENLIINFLCIAQEYVDIEGFVQKRANVMCNICGNVMEHSETSFICKYCGREVEILDDTPSFKDISRVTTASKYEYVRNGHFIKAYKEFQGIHSVNRKNLKKAEERLLKDMEIYGLTRETVTKDHLYFFLSDAGMSSNYSNIHLLHANITGIPCVELSRWEGDIMNIFHQQEVAYDIVKDAERDNSLIVNYKLLKVLQRLTYVLKLDFDFRKRDFYCLKTNDKKCEHDEVMEKAWNYLGWEWISST